MTAIFGNFPLTMKLARREFEQRFRGSFLGWFWALLVPLAMLAVYSLVFGVIFQSRWQRPGTDIQSEYGFPLLLFSGLIMFNFFGDQFNRAPGLVLENVSYVKKVVFPLDVLVVVSMLTSLATAGISFVAFFAIYITFHGLPPFTALLLPLTIVPLAFVTMGISYVFASLGVFLRDLKHITPLLSTALLFMSSVFYDPSTLPETYRWLVYLNPVTPAVNFMRDLVFWGSVPSPLSYLSYFVFSVIVLLTGHTWFVRTQKAFADVI